jgi:hypothetical protein
VIGKIENVFIDNDNYCGITLPKTEGFSINEASFFKWNDENIKKGAICSGGSY